MENTKYPYYEVDKADNLKELVELTAKKYGNNTAFCYEKAGQTVNISYLQFKTNVEALGTILFDMGIRNTKVAVIGENSYAWILTYFAVVSSGNVIIPLDRELPASDINNILIDSGAEMLVYSPAYSSILIQIKEKNNITRQYVNMDSFPSMLENGRIMMTQGNTSVADYLVDNNALAALLYTSGTTGSAKGVMLSHKNLASDAVAFCKNLSLKGDSLLVLPLHHSFTFTCCILSMLLEGNVIAINQGLNSLHKDLLKYKPRNVFMVPLLVETFYKQIQVGLERNKGIETESLIKSIFGDNLTTIACGGAPIDSKYVAGYRDLGIQLIEGYGTTECSPVISVNRNKHYRDGSIGQVLPCCEVKIVEPDETGHGEICVKGDNVMIGYYKNEQATREVLDGEWLRTGDIGYLDEEGFLYISGRKKNLIILSNGKNVYPEELEFALLKIPYIKEVVVYAENDLIVAEVLLDTENYADCETMLDKDIMKFNLTQPSFKNIGKKVIRHTEFAKTTTKKIIRRHS